MSSRLLIFAILICFLATVTNSGFIITIDGKPTSTDQVPACTSPISDSTKRELGLPDFIPTRVDEYTVVCSTVNQDRHYNGAYCGPEGTTQWWLTGRVCRFYCKCTCDVNNNDMGGHLYARRRFNNCNVQQVRFICQVIVGCVCHRWDWPDPQIPKLRHLVRQVAKRIPPEGAADMAALLEEDELVNGPFAEGEREGLWLQWHHEVQLVESGLAEAWDEDAGVQMLEEFEWR